MGNFFSNPVEQTIKKNQEYISEMNKIKVNFFLNKFLFFFFNKICLKMERWIQMHYQMRERQQAMEISKNRELFYWISSFYAVSVLGLISK